MSTPSTTERVTAVGPTAFLRQHGYDIEEMPHSDADADLLERHGQRDNGLPVRRLRSGVQRLHKEGKISGAEMAAAERWSADYSLGVLGALDPSRRGSSCRGDLHGFLCARVDAVTRHREAKAAIGIMGDDLLRMFVAESRGLIAIAIAAALAAAQMPAAPPTATKKQSAIWRADFEKKAALTRQEIVGALVVTIRLLTEFYAARSSDKRQSTWWRPLDPETGRTVLRTKTVSVQAITRPEFRMPPKAA